MKTLVRQRVGFPGPGGPSISLAKCSSICFFTEFLKKIEEKFVSFVQKIIDESQQTVVTFSSDKLVIFFRKSLNENDNFWKMVFSDGTRHNIFKAREEMKLITLYQCKVKDCKWKEEGRLWYVWKTHEVTNKTIGNKEGVYIEINEKLINHENETLIRLVRDNHPAYEGDDEALKIQLKREFIFLQDERHCLINVNIAGQLNMLGSVDESKLLLFSDNIHNNRKAYIGAVLCLSRLNLDPQKNSSLCNQTFIER